MHREGHIGAALLAYAPVGTALAMAGDGSLALVGAAVMVVASLVPDWDERVPIMRSRGVTHTVLFAFLVGVVLWALGISVADQFGALSRATVGSYGFFVGSLAVIVHVAVDALTPAGVRPFWPVWGRTFSLGVTRPENPVANYMLLALGLLATSVSLLLVAG